MGAPSNGNGKGKNKDQEMMRDTLGFLKKSE